MDSEPEASFVYARGALRRIVLMGFQRIYILQHHQGPDALQVLCLKRATVEVLCETTSAWGAGWGRRPYESNPHPNIFGGIQVAYLDSFSKYPAPDAERVPVGHAGRGEMQLIQAALPETVRMDALHSLGMLPEWLQDTCQEDAGEGKRWIEFYLQGWVHELSQSERYQ